MSESQVLNVFIEGDKSGFNSKNAFDKFKQAVKSSDNFDLVELTKKYIKSGFVVEQVDRTNNDIKFMVGKENQESKEETVVPQLSEKDQKRQMLKAKINLMRQDRTNSVYHKAKASNNVPDEILSEYMKLKQISKTPIPEPNEILAHPEEYKPIISMILQNSMMKQLNSTHPYVRYFKLIAEKIGLEMPLPMPTQDFLSGNKIQDMSQFETLMKASEQVTDIKGNEMSKDEQTDSEDDMEV